ncbi:tetratricopeptide repeat protein [Sphingobacterium sp. KU25419]|nr:tetratricopeptide repeat protein [Sphingobacterium sp. KU25419]
MLQPNHRLTISMLLLMCSGLVPLSAKPTIPLHDTVAINNQNQYALTLWSSKPDSLILISKKMLDRSNQIGYTVGKIDAYRNLGAGYYEKGEYNKSITYYEEAIKLAQKHGDLAKQGQSMSNISKSLIALGSHHEALNYLYQGLAIAEKINKKEIKAHILHNMGMVYHYQDMGKEAIDYYKRSRSTYEAIGDTTKTTFILGNIAHLYLDNNQHKLAEDYYILSLQLARQYKNKKAIGNALISLGNFNSKLNHELVAIDYYLQAKKILEELGEKTEYLRVLINLATSYKKQQQYNKAFQYAQLNYQLASEQQQIYYISASSELLSALYEKMGKPQLALDYYKQFNRAQDSLYSTSNKEELVRLKERYTFEKRQQQTDAAYLKHLNKKEMYIHLASLTVLSLIIIAILLLFYIRQKKKANRMLLQAKIAIEKQNIALKKTNDFKQQLLSLLAHDVRTPIANVKMILLLLDKTDQRENQLNNMIQSSQIEIEALMTFIENLLLWINLQLHEKKL